MSACFDAIFHNTSYKTFVWNLNVFLPLHLRLIHRSDDSLVPEWKHPPWSSPPSAPRPSWRCVSWPPRISSPDSEWLPVVNMKPNWLSEGSYFHLATSPPHQYIIQHFMDSKAQSEGLVLRKWQFRTLSASTSSRIISEHGDLIITECWNNPTDWLKLLSH